MNQAITRLRPWDLNEAVQGYGDLKVSEVITAMQNEENRLYDCPKCVDLSNPNGQPTGKIEVTLSDDSTATVVCDVCAGFLKTTLPYEHRGCGVYEPVAQ